jgi:hypothetical protein
MPARESFGKKKVSKTGNSVQVFLTLVTDAVLSQEEVYRILPETVRKIVLVISRYRILQVRQESPRRPLSRPREVGLERPGARVLNGENVGVVGPHAAKDALHVPGTRKI